MIRKSSATARIPGVPHCCSSYAAPEPTSHFVSARRQKRGSGAVQRPRINPLTPIATLQPAMHGRQPLPRSETAEGHPRPWHAARHAPITRDGGPVHTFFSSVRAPAPPPLHTPSHFAPTQAPAALYQAFVPRHWPPPPGVQRESAAPASTCCAGQRRWMGALCCRSIANATRSHTSTPLPPKNTKDGATKRRQTHVKAQLLTWRCNDSGKPVEVERVRPSRGDAFSSAGIPTFPGTCDGLPSCAPCEGAWGGCPAAQTVGLNPRDRGLRPCRLESTSCFTRALGQLRV